MHAFEGPELLVKGRKQLEASEGVLFKEERVCSIQSSLSGVAALTENTAYEARFLLLCTGQNQVEKSSDLLGFN
ncbi:hypothetical protein CEY02_03575 [Bacillus pumilus]|uniref:Uncharacterized protein n=1 Tax=Bacillus pumilus TaxID=1408 RepID=A0A2A5IZ83_BACPU|nr:hypothetical protein [Bacillus pumilus]PCK22640.1 hypothetical protein CEY02_03575 [Bacillus pumilus]